MAPDGAGSGALLCNNLLKRLDSDPPELLDLACGSPCPRIYRSGVVSRLSHSDALTLTQPCHATIRNSWECGNVQSFCIPLARAVKGYTRPWRMHMRYEVRWLEVYMQHIFMGEEHARHKESARDRLPAAMRPAVGVGGTVSRTYLFPVTFETAYSVLVSADSRIQPI